MTTPNNKSSSGSEHQLNKSPKPKKSLSFSTWILLIISFTLLAYALYTIQTRVVLEVPAETNQSVGDVIQMQ
jgi:flagellar basal body-associated protein FliL